MAEGSEPIGADECECEAVAKAGFVQVAIYDTMEELLGDVKSIGLTAGSYRVVDLNGDDGPGFLLHIKEGWEIPA